MDMNIHRIEKVLTFTDTGDTGSHQSGIGISKGDVSFFPPLDSELKNPRLEVEFKDQHGNTWPLQFIYYNNKLFGGTRDEYRLTGTSGFISKFALNPGDTVIFERIGDGNYKILYSSSSSTSAQISNFINENRPVNPSGNLPDNILYEYSSNTEGMDYIFEEPVDILTVPELMSDFIEEGHQNVYQHLDDLNDPIDVLHIPESEYLSTSYLAGQSIKELPIDIICHIMPAIATTNLMSILSSNKVYVLKDLEGFKYTNILSEENVLLLEDSIEWILAFISRYTGTPNLCDPYHILKILYPNNLPSTRDLSIFITRLSTTRTLQDLGDEWGITRERIRQIEARAKKNLEHYLNNSSMLTLLLFFVNRAISNIIVQSGSEVFTYPELSEHLDLDLESLFLLKGIFEIQTTSFSETAPLFNPKYDVLFDNDTIFIRPDVLKELSDKKLQDTINSVLKPNTVLSATQLLADLAEDLNLPGLETSSYRNHLLSFLVQSRIVETIPSFNTDSKQYGTWVCIPKTFTSVQLQIISALLYARDSYDKNEPNQQYGLYWDDVVNYINARFESPTRNIRSTVAICERHPSLFYFTDNGKIALTACYAGPRTEPVESNKLIVSAISILIAKGYHTTQSDIILLLEDYVSSATAIKYIKECVRSNLITMESGQYQITDDYSIVPDVNYLYKIPLSKKEVGLAGKIIGILESLDSDLGLTMDQIYSNLNKDVPGVNVNSITYILNNNLKDSVTKSANTFHLNKERIERIKSDSGIPLRDVILSAIGELGGYAEIERLFHVVDGHRATTWGLFSATVRHMTEDNILAFDGESYSLNIP